MVDLGIYNFIRNALEQGKDETEVRAILERGGRSAGDIDEAFAAVRSKRPPNSAAPAHAFSLSRFAAAVRRPRAWLRVLAYSSVIIVILLIALAGAGIAYQAGMFSGASSTPTVAPATPSPRRVPFAASAVESVVRSNIDAIRNEAELIGAAPDNSYVSLCADGIVRTADPSGASRPALAQAVSYVMSIQGAATQQDAGIACYATRSAYTVSARLSDGSSWCIDNSGTSGQGAADRSTVSCVR